MKILVINGPNINMLGIREPDIYGRETYADLLEKIKNYADKKGVEVDFFQSNHEGDIVDKIQQSYNKIDGIVMNPAAYTHTSVAIPDALKAVGIPTVKGKGYGRLLRSNRRLDGSFSAIQPKAFLTYNNIVCEIFELSCEKISRQKIKDNFRDTNFIPLGI